MAYDQFHQINATSQMIEVALRSATTGQLLTGIAYGDVTAKYVREGSNTQVTVSVVTATQGTFTSGGWVETGIAGVYQFGIPDAALATGAKAVTLVFSAPGALDVVKRVVLVSEDLRDALISSRLAPTTSGRTLNVGADGIAEANVKQWHGVAPLALSGSLVQVLIGEGVHGSTSATLTLGRLTLSDSTMGGKALVIQAINTGGKAIEIKGGWKAIEVTGDVEGLPGLSAQEVRDAMMLAPSAGTPAAGSVDAKLDDILEDTGTDIPAAIAGVPAATGALLSSEHGSGAWDGSGAIRSQIYTITVSGAPVAGVRCRMYADAGCTILVSAAVTNDAGQAVFWHALASGTTVYITRQHPGFVFSDPDTEVIP